MTGAPRFFAVAFAVAVLVVIAIGAA